MNTPLSLQGRNHYRRRPSRVVGAKGTANQRRAGRPLMAPFRQYTPAFCPQITGRAALLTEDAFKSFPHRLSRTGCPQAVHKYADVL